MKATWSPPQRKASFLLPLLAGTLAGLTIVLVPVLLGLSLARLLSTHHHAPTTDAPASMDTPHPHLRKRPSPRRLRADTILNNRNLFDPHKAPVMAPVTLAPTIALAHKDEQEAQLLCIKSTAGKPHHASSLHKLPIKYRRVSTRTHRDFMQLQPRFEGADQQGFTVTAVQPTSLFARLGLQRGDTLQQINGKAPAHTGQTRLPQKTPWQLRFARGHNTHQLHCLISGKQEISRLFFLSRARAYTFLQRTHSPLASRATPVYQKGRYAGLRLDHVGPGSFLASLGLRTGDQVTHFNGRKLQAEISPKEYIYHNPRMTMFLLRIEREGQPRSFLYLMPRSPLHY